jgi:uncharacterized membrane protein
MSVGRLACVMAKETVFRWHEKALVQVGLCVGIGLVIAVATAMAGAAWAAPLVGWDAAAAVYLVWTWLVVGRMAADATADQAGVEDPTLAGADVLLLNAGVASLIAVGL